MKVQLWMNVENAEDPFAPVIRLTRDVDWPQWLALPIASKRVTIGVGGFSHDVEAIELYPEQNPELIWAIIICSPVRLPQDDVEFEALGLEQLGWRRRP
jgi:hypothetical protein